MTQIEKFTVKGYQSIKALENFELRPLNVLIGANGAGKSNFIGLFRFRASLVGDNFPLDVQKWGEPEALLHYGNKVTPQMELEIQFSPNVGVTGSFENGYRVTLEATHDNRLIFSREEATVRGAGYSLPKIDSTGHCGSALNYDRVKPHLRNTLRQKSALW
jgi:predicted ATPase